MSWKLLEPFKLKKNELRDEAFHLDKVNNDLVFVREPKSECYNRTY
jgi:hypothetical protein